MEKITLQRFWSIAKPENLKLYDLHEWMDSQNLDISKHRTVSEWKELVRKFRVRDESEESEFSIKLCIG